MNYIDTAHGRFWDNVETGKTAQEVYDEWLANLNKPIVNPDDVLKSKIEVVTINTLIDLGVI